jgi:hypothetical protein
MRNGNLSTSDQSSKGKPEEFSFKEYDSLQEQVRATRDDSRAVERNVIVAIGLFWAFLIKESSSVKMLPHPSLAWWIPVLFSILGAARSAALGFKQESLSIYLRQLESLFAAEEDVTPKGWEHFEKKRGGFIRISAWLFWFILMTVTVIVAMKESS